MSAFLISFDRTRSQSEAFARLCLALALVALSALLLPVAGAVIVTGAALAAMASPLVLVAIVGTLVVRALVETPAPTEEPLPLMAWATHAITSEDDDVIQLLDAPIPYALSAAPALCILPFPPSVLPVDADADATPEELYQRCKEVGCKGVRRGWKRETYLARLVLSSHVA